MLHSKDPHRAAIMLSLCHEGNHIYEMVYSFSNGHTGWSFVQAADIDEAEEILFKARPEIEAYMYREVKP